MKTLNSVSKNSGAKHSQLRGAMRTQASLSLTRNPFDIAPNGAARHP